MNDGPRSQSDTPRDGERPTLDSLFDALGHPYRRRILTTLADTDPCKEDDFTPATFVEDDEEFEERLADLHHRHLPHLDDAGFVDWDREADTVRRGPRYDEIGPLVELMIAHEDELPADWP